jgi:cytochrome oxidase Cu insertion factor (SCO1/SenC/PrrC family)
LQEATIVRLFSVIFTLLLFSTGLALNAQTSTPSQRSTPLAVGALAPDFTLDDQNGKKVSLSASRNKNAVVLVFYRGYW